MVHKRPFSDEESYEVSSKHPRQVDYSNQLVSILKFVHADDTARKPNVSDEGSFTEDDEKHAGGIIPEHPISAEKHSKSNVSGVSNTSWASHSTSEEDDVSEAPFHLLFSPERYNAEHPIRTPVPSEEIRTSLWEFPPHKLVPIGPNFQADVPEWGAQGAKNDSDGSDESTLLTFFPQALESDLSDRNDFDNKLAGICVTPVLEFGPSADNNDKVGDGRTDCYCEDPGSVSCVRQHVKEARERLWRTLGHEKFSELGFSDMGEVVAEKWTHDEEMLFREVVFSNPVSLGKNFWDHLSIAFPSRTKKDFVSYYFNVFMLQTRSVQNRYDPTNINSDDDEWQGIEASEDEDSVADEVGNGEEDEDSVAESPACRDNSSHDEILHYDSHEYDESVSCNGFFNHCEDIKVGCDVGTINVPETCSWKLVSTCGPNPTLQLPGKHLWDETRDHGSSQDKNGGHDSQGDSCGSDGGTSSQAMPLKANNGKCHMDSSDSINVGDTHEFVFEHCDTRVWDVGYSMFPKNELEFSPTCSMIEEVFGVGAWNYMAGDGKGLS